MRHFSGAATQQWILQRLHHKTDLILATLHKKLILFKKCNQLHHLSQSSRETNLLYGTFVHLCKQCFVVQPLQSQPLCSSTVFADFKIQWFGVTIIDAYCELYSVEFLQSQMSLIALQQILSHYMLICYLW